MRKQVSGKRARKELAAGLDSAGIARSIPVFAYLRVSSLGQVDGDGFERQEQAIRAYCAAHGMHVRAVYREEASGTRESMNRPAWIEMMKVIMANGVKTIVVERLDRLARDLMIQEHIIADTRERGITLISAAEPDLCVDDPSRKLMRQIMGSIAEYDRTMIVLKTRAARERIRARGERCEGAKPYGELPGEDKVMELIEMCRDDLHYSPARTAEYLNELLIEPRRGLKWHPHVVARIMKRVST